MNICDLVSGANRLTRATRQLRECWAETKEMWDDAVSREFEEKYLEPLIPHLRLTSAAIHEMSKVMDDARRACEDRQMGE